MESRNYLIGNLSEYLNIYTQLIGVIVGVLVAIYLIILVWQASRRERAEKRLTELIKQNDSSPPYLEGKSDDGSIARGHGQGADPVKVAMQRQQERLTALAALGDSYHEQALGQARVQFRVSTVAASVGFLLIIYGGFMQISSAPIEAADIVLGVLPGAVIEAVAALFFAQAASTRQRATDFYSRLQDDQRSRQALEIADGIQEPSLRSLVYSQMALHIAGLATSELDIQSVLGKASVETLEGKSRE